MGHRITKIYTKTGDDGTTGLGNGHRVPKYDLRVETYGTVDELSSHVGLLRAYISEPSLLQPSFLQASLLQSSPKTTDIQREVQQLEFYLSLIQHWLFDLGGELSIPDFMLLKESQVSQLEQWIDEQNEHLPPLKDFILPAGTIAVSQAHVCRTVCRRAERLIVELQQTDTSINGVAVRFLNRLSDFFFVFARSLCRLTATPEVYWQKST